jgi:two-component system sensor histidine kinase QseC
LGTSLKNNIPTAISIQKRLIASTVSIATLLIFTSWILVFHQTKNEVDEVYDARLGQLTKILALSMPSVMDLAPSARYKIYADWSSVISDVDHDKMNLFPRVENPDDQNLFFQLYIDGYMVFKSPGAPEPLNIVDRYSGTVNLNNQRWHYFQLKIPSRVNPNAFVVVAEKQSVRDEVVNEIALSTSLPQLLLIPILALILFFLIKKFLRPVNELRLAVSQCDVNKLEPIKIDHPAIELEPLVEQLNYLLSELDNAQERERRFTRTAAHELKTPLAVLRLNIENALASEDQGSQAYALNNIVRGVDRTDRLIQQLLMHSRIEAKQRHVFKNINIASLMREVIALLAPLALKNHQDISYTGPDEYIIQGEAIFLSILFSNLIDNAIRYSGENSEIKIILSVEQSESLHNTVKVLVQDNGPPIPTAVRDKIFEKFFRAHSEKGDGAGLGMAIAAEAAKLHGASISLLPYDQTLLNSFFFTMSCENKKCLS